MIDYLRGTVQSVEEGVVIFDVNGVGYEVHCTPGLIESFSSGVEAINVVYTVNGQTYVPKLFGFLNTNERDMFNTLTSVQGIGHSTAMSILRNINHKGLALLIVSGDATGFKNIKGIGPKTAKRLITELGDKLRKTVKDIDAIKSSVDPSVVDDAVKALRALGYTSGVQKAVEAIAQNQTQSTSDIIKTFLSNQ